MRKKIILLLSFVLALTLSLGIFAACTSKVEITLSRTEMTVETGKSQTVKATTSTGVEVVWKSSDETIATVDGGKVTGVKAGTATITATAAKGKGSAKCEVTVKDPVVFTFKNDKGEEVSNVLVDRNGEPVKLTVTTSDGSRVTSWSSEDEKIASVEGGLITGLYDGETTIIVKTPTATGKIKVTVYDTFQGEKYDITDQESSTKWYYWFEHPEITEILYNEYRGGVTFGFSGGNWNHDSIKLIYRAEKWEAWLWFEAKVEVDFDATINILGTRVALHEGVNEVKVKYLYYPQFAYACLIEFGTTKDGSLESGTIKITDMIWFNGEEEQLTAPSFTLEEDNVVITDTNDEIGVQEYRLGLFENAEDEKPVFAQVLGGKNAAVDVSKFAGVGNYYIKIMAVGNPGYKDSAWSEAAAYTVKEHTVEYEVPEGGGSVAMNNAGWYLFMVDGGSVLEPAVYSGGTLTLKSGYLGWAFYSTELLYHCPEFANGTQLLIAMNINASHAGTITVAGTVVELVEGDNQIYVKKEQKNEVTVAILFGKWMPDTNDKGIVDFPLNTELTFVISDFSVTEYQAVNLKPVTGVVDAENKKIEVSNENEAGVKGYELGFFVGDTLMKNTSLNEDGTFRDDILNDGTYILKIRAIASDIRYIAADWTVVAQEYEVKNGGATYDVIFGGDQDGDKPTGNALTNPNTWYYWNDQNWTGSSTEVTKAEIVKGVLTIEYKVNSGSCDHGVQIYYKDPSIKGDNKLTLKIETEKAIDVTLNDAKLHLEEGVNNITVYYTQGGSYSFSMQVVVNDEVTENVLKISELKYEVYTFINLVAPQLTVEEDGTITITDTNEEVNVNSYVIGYFTAGATNPFATIEVKNGEKLDYSMVDSGTYTLKIKATAADNKGYKDSGWSAGIEYTVDNPEGAHYQLGTGFGGGDAQSNPGLWGVWADRGWTGSWVDVTEATYNNGEITVSFTADGKCSWGLQFNYVNPNYVAGTKYSFDIVATADMDIQVEDGGSNVIHLTAGEKVTLTGGADASFYVQVNINGYVGGTITISNVQWN